MKHLNKLLLIAILLFLLCGCSQTSSEPISKTGVYFDTVITITLYDSTDSKLLDACFSKCQEYENLLSRRISTSDIARINTANGQPIQVSDFTVEIIKKGIEYGDLTNGLFDITIAPLVDLWDIKNNDGQLPSEDMIHEALSHVDYKQIVINNNEVCLLDPLASIDLGAIAKGYIADYLKDFLIESGVTSGLINLGGNILTIGRKPDETAFRIGIQKPFDKKNSTITAVTANDSSVVTSGSYERYFAIDEQIYHHILNPFTGFPCDNDLLSVTILSDSSVAGDALSTSCFLMGLEEGKAFIQNQENIDAIFITKDYQIIDTRK